MLPPLDSVEEVTVAKTVLRTSLRTTIPPDASAFEAVMLMLGMWLTMLSYLIWLHNGPEKSTVPRSTVLLDSRSLTTTSDHLLASAKLVELLLPWVRSIGRPD